MVRRSRKTSAVKKIVIADAGPLIALARIGKLSLLPRLFGTVLLTDLVASELTDGGVFADTAVLRDAFAAAWLETIKTSSQDLLQCRDWVNLYQIDLGEASALVLATTHAALGNDVLIILDDARGRQAAQHARLNVLGTAGLLILAKNAKMIDEVKPLLLALQAENYFLSERLLQAVLQMANEK